MVKGSDLEVRKNEELRESSKSPRKASDVMTNDVKPRRSRRIKEKNKQVDFEGPRGCGLPPGQGRRRSEDQRAVGTTIREARHQLAITVTGADNGKRESNQLTV